MRNFFIFPILTAILCLSTVNANAAFPIVKEAVAVEQSTIDNTDSESSIVNNEESVTSGGKSQLIAALLCFFLGGIGVHRFYLGYIGIGIIQLLTFGGFGIWVLIDFVRILIGDLEPKDGSYDKTF